MSTDINIHNPSTAVEMNVQRTAALRLRARRREHDPEGVPEVPGEHLRRHRVRQRARYRTHRRAQRDQRHQRHTVHVGVHMSSLARSAGHRVRAQNSTMGPQCARSFAPTTRSSPTDRRGIRRRLRTRPVGEGSLGEGSGDDAPLACDLRVRAHGVPGSPRRSQVHARGNYRVHRLTCTPAAGRTCPAAGGQDGLLRPARRVPVPRRTSTPLPGRSARRVA